MVKKYQMSLAGEEQWELKALVPKGRVADICPSLVLSLLRTTVVAALCGVWCLTSGSIGR